MIYNICPMCGKQYDKSLGTCPNGCSDKRKKYSSATYDKHQRKNYNIYHDKRWLKLTQMCKMLASGIDVYAYNKYGRMVAGSLSHHIIEVNEDIKLAFDINNLIWLSAESHAEIHKIYNDSLCSKLETQAYLKSII